MNSSSWSRISEHAAVVAEHLGYLESVLPLLNGSEKDPRLSSQNETSASSAATKEQIVLLPEALPGPHKRASISNQSSLNLERVRDKVKKRELRNQTGALIKILEGLLPPAMGFRQRTLHETLQAAAAHVDRPLRGAIIRQGMLAQQGCGWLLLDTATCTVVEANRFVAERLGQTAPRGSELLCMLDEPTAEDLALVVGHLALARFRDPQATICTLSRPTRHNLMRRPDLKRRAYAQRTAPTVIQ